ncbi:MAG: MFS transporter [Planctomycetes bacterium]|nr:MFS transporter [Planctomycetota bacterium]
MSQASGTAEGCAGAARSTHVRRGVLAMTCTLAAVSYIHRAGFATAGTYLRDDLGLTGEQYGAVMTAFLVAYGLFEVPWGFIGDRLGARHALTAAALGWSLLTGAVGLVAVAASLPASAGPILTPFALLLVLRFLFGAFQAGAFPVIARVMADWMPITERGTAQGLIWAASRIGGVAAPYLVGPLALGLGWAGAMALITLLGVVWCAAFWPWFRNRPEEMARVNAAERERIARGRVQRPAGHGGTPWREMLSSPSVWALCLMYGCGGFTATFFITWLPDYLRKQRGLGPGEMQLLSALPLACGVVACVGGGFISDWTIRRTGNRKWGRRLNGVVGYACAGLAIVSTNWVEDVWALAALLSAAFACFDLAMGPAWASCADIGERHAGTLAGAMNMVGNLGSALGSMTCGFLFGKRFGAIAGNDLMFIVFGASFWLGALCWLRVDVTRRLGTT